MTVNGTLVLHIFKHGSAFYANELLGEYIIPWGKILCDKIGIVDFIDG
jgi:hypothetical protein